MGAAGPSPHPVLQAQGEGGAGAQQGQKIPVKTTPRSREEQTLLAGTVKIKGDLSAQG